MSIEGREPHREWLARSTIEAIDAWRAAFRFDATREARENPEMIVEYIRYEVKVERADEFVAAYSGAAIELRGSPHCLGFEITRCTEEPTSFVVRIEWDSLDGHLKGFRAEPAFASFFAKVKPFFDEVREMRHYARTDLVWTRS